MIQTSILDASYRYMLIRWGGHCDVEGVLVSNASDNAKSRLLSNGGFDACSQAIQ